MKRTTLALAVAIVAAAGVLVSGGLATSQGPATEQLFGALSGTNEIGPDGKKRAGDPNGTGGATGTIKDQPGENSDLCVGLVFKDLGAPAAAHIHRGKAHEHGPVVVGFFGAPTSTGPPSSGDPGAFGGCVSITDALAREIQKTPSHFYWNVHTSEFPNGAIRSQVRGRRP